MKALEIYLNGEGFANGKCQSYHTLMIVDGHRRERHEFTSTDPNAMYGEAARLIESDPSFEKSARVIDPSRKVIRNGDMRLSLKNLRFFKNHAGKAPQEAS
jgi:hypothetical protein